MDTSADDHQQAFQIRRSPSIGSGSSVVAPTASRAGKRKLSATAFGSSPNMGPASTPDLRSASPSDGSVPSSHVDHPTPSAQVGHSGTNSSSTERFDPQHETHSCHGPGLLHSHSENGTLAAERLHSLYPHVEHGGMTSAPQHHTEGVSSQFQASLEAAGPSSRRLDSNVNDPLASTSGGREAAQLHELQEWRCHTLNMDRDYVLSNEDRRDPRSLSACVIVPLASGGDTGGVSDCEAKLAGGLHENLGLSYEDSSHAAEREVTSTEPLIIGCDSSDSRPVRLSDESPEPGGVPSETTPPHYPSRTVDGAAFRNEGHPDGDLGSKVSSSVGPSSTPFFTSSYFFSTPSPHQRQIAKAAMHSSSSERTSQLPLACPSPSLDVSRASTGVEPAGSEADAGFGRKQRGKGNVRQERGRMPDLLALPPRGWTRTTGLMDSPMFPTGPDRSTRVGTLPPGHMQMRSAAAAGAAIAHGDEKTDKGEALAPFQLQPVPAGKRRKVQVSVNDVGLSRLHDSEGRRRSEAGACIGLDAKAVHSSSPSSLRNEFASSSSSRRDPAQFPPARVPSELASGLLQPSKAANTTMAVAGPSINDTNADGSISRVYHTGIPSALSSRPANRGYRGQSATKASGLAPVPQLPSRPSLLSIKRNAILPPPNGTPSAAHHAVAPMSNRRRPSRLRRAHSVPNMRAKATLDLVSNAQHRFIFPHHWISYISSHSRSSKDGISNYVGSGRASAAFRLYAKAAPTLGQLVASSSRGRSRALFTPSLHPPITRHTLRELDLFEILKNPQLRHDVVFDPNVQFRPNFDGERGRRKREAGERYWSAVVREIETGCTCTAFDMGELLPCTCNSQRGKGSLASATESGRCSKASSSGGGMRTPSTRVPNPRAPSRIPLLVQELRAICLSILPSNFPIEGGAASAVNPADRSASHAAPQSDRDANGKMQGSAASGDASAAATPTANVSSGNQAATASGPSWAATHHSLIAQTLDPHLISQELQHGVLDVPALVSFMGSILKLHCAPMRDEAIEKMVEVVCVEGDIGKGLRLCFEILELMKLDIANHQLRSTRPYLVETAVEFEVRWFRDQIEQKKISLERTSAWFISSLGRARAEVPNCGRSELVSRAFNDGLLKLIFDAPSSNHVPASPAPAPSPSSSSLNHTFSACYPETFQFDAYRMMTFHNDVADLTIVYMLLLLFRQLACSPLEGSSSAPSSAAGIAQRQLNSVKGEIWCLLNDANLCLSSGPGSASQPSAVLSRKSPSFDNKLFLGSAGGFAKLDHPRWRRAMQNVLLQIAVRAHAVQLAAHGPVTDPTEIKPPAPSAKMQTLLNSWMETNLCAGSKLHKICQGRLQGAVLAMLGDKLSIAHGSAPVAATPGLDKPGRRAINQPPADQSSTATIRKRTSVDSTASDQVDSGSSVDVQTKRIKTDGPVTDLAKTAIQATLSATAMSAATLAAPQERSAEAQESESVAAAASFTTASWEATLARAGLDPFSAEIRLLCDRIAKVAGFHLRVFRNLYEKTEAESVKAVAANGA